MRKKGFTLVEILLVIIIVGILAAITIPRIVYDKNLAQKAACKANIAAVNSQLELWRLNKADYPDPVASMFADEEYFPDGEPVCPFGTAFPYVLGANHRITPHTH